MFPGCNYSKIVYVVDGASVRDFIDMMDLIFTIFSPPEQPQSAMVSDFPLRKASSPTTAGGPLLICCEDKNIAGAMGARDVFVLAVESAGFEAGLTVFRTPFFKNFNFHFGCVRIPWIGVKQYI